MDLKSLDEFLRNMTEKEALYKTEYEKNHSIEPSKVHPKKIKFDLFPEVNIKGLDVSVKKNSRFNPIPMHNHDYVEIIYVYSGSSTHKIGKTDILLEKGQVLLIDVNTSHSVDMLNENDIMINIGMSKKYLHYNLLNHLSSSSMLSTFFINAMNEKTQSLKYIHFKSENSRRLPIFINEFLCEFYDPSINSTDILANLLGLIVAELINIFEQSMKKDISKKNKMSIVPIIHYIEENFQNCTLKSVSKKFGLNPVYLSSLLKKNFGMNYKQIIQNKKLTYASKLLKNTEMSVTDIANEVGYENINFFYKKFKTIYGCTPGEFRNKL